MNELPIKINNEIGTIVDELFTKISTGGENTKTCFEISKYKKTFKCPTCNRMFKEKGNLKTHQRIHTGERPYVCKYDGCNKTFITFGNLKSHICNHTGERPYKCTYDGCHKKYSRSSRLRIHERTHSDYRPYECPWETCGKKFNEKGNLKTHYRVHTGEKPYKCTYQDCKQEFKAHGHLKDHVKRHLNIRQYECHFCNARFGRTSTLKIHLYTHKSQKGNNYRIHLKEHPDTERDNMRINLNKIETQKNMEITQEVTLTTTGINKSSLTIRTPIEEIRKSTTIVKENEEIQKNMIEKEPTHEPSNKQETQNYLFARTFNSLKSSTNNFLLNYLIQNILQKTPDYNTIANLIYLSFITKLSIKNLLLIVIKFLNESQNFFDIDEIQLCLNIITLDTMVNMLNMSSY